MSLEEKGRYKIIKENYPQKGTDYTKLFANIVSIANEIGLDRTLGLVSRRGEERRAVWIEKTTNSFKKGKDPFDDVLNIFYKGCIGIEIDKDGKIVERTEKKLVTRWWNYCPILEACKKYGLDTQEVCRKGFHKQNQLTLSSIDPRLKFDRNYENGLRPHRSYCEEIITLADG